MSQTYITHLGKFLPGAPIDNDQMEAYLGLINGKPSKIKRRILASNGIRQRHYALDQQQQTTHLNHQMAAAAVRNALDNAHLDPAAVDLLCAATTWPDLLVPGFASMVHGELPEFSPLEATSHQGVCCAGVAALKYAATQISQGQKRCAVAVASESAARLFKHTQFEAQPDIRAGKAVPFDTEFLRWMLSDGAGAMVLRNRPNAEGISLRLDWIELVSHANAHPVCMYAGVDSAQATQSWMDYPSLADAAAAGATHLRQNIRLLDQVVQLGVEGWLRLLEAGRIRPAEIDWLLCHYSSHVFRSQIVDLLEKANAMIPEERWFTNLYTKGNTGCASIFLMLEELFYSGKLQPGQTIFCFVPESGRFTTAYLKLTVVDGTAALPPASTAQPAATVLTPIFESRGGALGSQAGARPSQEPGEWGLIDAAAAPAGSDIQAELLRQLTLTWLAFERQLQSVPLIRQLNRGEFTLDSYRALLRNLRPQVVEGARWIARAASNMEDFQVRSHFIGHAQAEHRDFQMLERNYVAVGGTLMDIVNADQNLGSEALSAFIFHRASQLNPVDLIGSMFIIEGLGSRLARRWADQIQQQLRLTKDQVSFLAYHSENDDSHTDKLNAIVQAEWITAEIAARMVKTAQVTARLYRLQLEEIN